MLNQSRLPTSSKCNRSFPNPEPISMPVIRNEDNTSWAAIFFFFFYAQQITLSRLYCLKPSKPIFKVITSYTTLQASSSLSFIYFQLICCFFSTNCTIFSSCSWSPTFSTLLVGWIDGEVCVCVYPVFPSLIITLALSNHIYPNNCYAREIWLTSYL